LYRTSACLAADPCSGAGVVWRCWRSNSKLCKQAAVAQVQIIAHNILKGTDHNAVSGLDGTFTMARLEPGAYQVAAVREGFIASTANVEVSAPETYRIDFLLAEEHPPVPEAKASAVDPSMSAVVEELAAMKERIAQLEAALRARHGFGGTTR